MIEHQERLYVAIGTRHKFIRLVLISLTPEKPTVLSSSVTTTAASCNNDFTTVFATFPLFYSAVTAKSIAFWWPKRNLSSRFSSSNAEPINQPTDRASVFLLPRQRVFNYSGAQELYTCIQPTAIVAIRSRQYVTNTKWVVKWQSGVSANERVLCRKTKVSVSITSPSS